MRWPQPGEFGWPPGRFAIKRPDLFLLRGTAVSLWFLISLLIAVGFLTFLVRLGVGRLLIGGIAVIAYLAVLLTSSYSSIVLRADLALPLEQRGPLIAIFFFFLGYLIHGAPLTKWRGVSILALGIVLMFLESIGLAYIKNTPFTETPYLFSTGLVAFAVFTTALQNPAFGAGTLLYPVGVYSLGIYVAHVPVLGALAGS